MSDNFDGGRDTRLIPQCICGEMMGVLDDGFCCDECGLLICDMEQRLPVIDSNNDASEIWKMDMPIEQHVHINIADQDEWYTALLIWDLMSFNMLVILHDEEKNAILNAIGLDVSQSSRYWE